MTREKGKYHIYVVGSGTIGEAESWGLWYGGNGRDPRMGSDMGPIVKTGSVMVQFPNGNVEVMQYSSYKYLELMMFDHNERMKYEMVVTDSEKAQDREKYIIGIINNLTNNFDSIGHEKYEIYNELDNEIAELLSESNSSDDKYYKQAVLTVHDAFASLPTEQLTVDQLKAFKRSFMELRSSRNKFQLDAVKIIDRELNDSGLYTIPHDKSRILTRRTYIPATTI